MGVDYAGAVRPYLDALHRAVDGLQFFDAHTHIGRNDPDGFSQEPERLLAQLEECDARAAVFPMHEPDGFGPANDEVLAAAETSGGRLVAFCRVNPNHGEAAVAEARRALDAGARGVKLHPRGERFTLSHPTIAPIVELAHERRLPVLIHAGRGIPALGEDTVRLSERYRGARMILAHAAISDLAWLWRVLPDHPNVYVDTAWWNPADIVAVFTLVPPGQVLWASDSPYGVPLLSAVEHLRCAQQAGLDADAIRAVAGGQFARLVAGEEPLDLGPAPRRAIALDPNLERVVSHLVSTLARAMVEGDHTEALALARLACAVPVDEDVAPLCAAVLELLDHAEQGHGPPPPYQSFPESLRFISTAAAVARTPTAGLP